MKTNPVKSKLAKHSTANQAIRAVGTEFGRIYQRRREHLNRRLQEAVLTNKPLDAKYLSTLIHLLGEEYAALEADFRDNLKRTVPYVCEGFFQNAMNDLHGGALGKFDRARAKVLLEDAYTHVAGATANMYASDVQYLRSLAARVFGKQALGDMTVQQAQAELLAGLEARQKFTFVDRGGKVWSNRAYSEMLGRTLSMNAGRQTYFDTCIEEGDDIVRVTVSGHACPDCAVWENRLLSITGKTQGLPTVEEAQAAGLMHPNCTHSFVAVPEVEARQRFARDGRPKDGLNSEENAVKNDKAAWKEYRKQQAKAKKKAADENSADDRGRNKGARSSDFSPATRAIINAHHVEPIHPNARGVSAVKVEEFDSKNLHANFNMSTAEVAISPERATQINRFVKNAQAAKTPEDWDNIPNKQLNGMRTLLHEMGHAAQDKSPEARHAKFITELANEERTRRHFVDELRKMGFDVPTSYGERIDKIADGYSQEITRWRELALKCGADLNDYRDYMSEVVAPADANKKGALFADFFGNRLKNMGYEGSVTCASLRDENSELIVWLKKHAKNM